MLRNSELLRNTNPFSYRDPKYRLAALFMNKLLKNRTALQDPFISQVILDSVWLYFMQIGVSDQSIMQNYPLRESDFDKTPWPEQKAMDLLLNRFSESICGLMRIAPGNLTDCFEMIQSTAIMIDQSAYGLCFALPTFMGSFDFETRIGYADSPSLRNPFWIYPENPILGDISELFLSQSSTEKTGPAMVTVTYSIQVSVVESQCRSAD